MRNPGAHSRSKILKRRKIFDSQRNELGQEAIRLIDCIRPDQACSDILIDNHNEPVTQFWRSVLRRL